VAVAAYRIPTKAPESDGTLSWDSTTLVIVEIVAGGKIGLGYTYASRAAATLIGDMFGPLLLERNAFETHALWDAMQVACRNLGQRGLTTMAIGACDVALHDLKARLLDVPLASLLGIRRERVPVYGSGGFTSYDERELVDQMVGWANEEIHAVKMKVGRDPPADPTRVAAVRAAIGDHIELFVDANGGYGRKLALANAQRFHDSGVTWFEEPVSSNDLEGLRLIRDQGPAGMDITAGEYGFDVGYFRRMAQAGAVDVLQPDATRCAGFTGFLLVDAVARAFELPISSHTAPALHLHCCCAAFQLRHMEWFFDHVRIEQDLFDGAPQLKRGHLYPDMSRPGLGLSFKRADAERYRC
jgi:L-alanine-DL-glutamate epimerase-like enolase superfamily enzyme